MLVSLAILLSGFSIFNALLLALTHFRHNHYQEQRVARLMGLLLLATLAGLQWLHFMYLQNQITLNQPLYYLLLFLVAPAFYLFSKPLLTANSAFKYLYFLHFLPACIALWLPFHIALPLAFLLGAAYLLWLAKTIYHLRNQRSRFRTELGVLGLIFLIALLVVALAMIMPFIPLLSTIHFFSLYTIAIGTAFILVSIALAYAPQMSTEVSEAVRETYAVSTLGQVDCDAVLKKLEQLMQRDELYCDNKLDLAGLAQRLELSSHQLSELINTKLGKHFSRYIREQRVAAAQQMLLAEPSVAVLAVGLSVGFTSQSNFYDAFREITGTTPGKYRKLNQQNTS